MLAKGTLRFFDRTVDNICMIVCLFVMIIGAYALYDSYMVYYDANDESLMQYKPKLGEDVPEARAMLDDYVAWLTIDDTNIDYPVMQGEDNSEYLNKDPYGQYSLSGSLFLDSRNKYDFTDPYSLIYGHHMEYGSMFGALDDFVDEDYLRSHRTGKLICAERAFDINIFCCVDAEASESAIFAPTETSIEETTSYIRANARVMLDYDPSLRLIAFSTCKFPDTTSRTIVFATLREMSQEEIHQQTTAENADVQ